MSVHKIIQYDYNVNMICKGKNCKLYINEDKIYCNKCMKIEKNKKLIQIFRNKRLLNSLIIKNKNRKDIDILNKLEKNLYVKVLKELKEKQI